MSDILGAGEWGKAVTKLLDVLDRSVGGCLRPWQMKRIAHAEVEVQHILAAGAVDTARLVVEREKLLAAGEREVAAVRALPARATDTNDDAIDVEFEEVPLATRAEERVAYQEERRQLNVENVVAGAAEELRSDPRVSDEPVDDDWAARFFACAQEVSAEQMQRLWAKVLAGEIRRPGSFSLRCLEALRNLTQTEAALFAKLCQCAHSFEVVVHQEMFFERSGMRLNEVMLLAEAGLVNNASLLSTNRGTDVPDRFVTVLSYSDEVMLVVQRDDPNHVMSLSSIMLTNAGRDLARIVGASPDRGYVFDVKDLLVSRGYAVEVRHILKREGNTFTFGDHVNDPRPAPAVASAS